MFSALVPWLGPVPCVGGVEYSDGAVGSAQVAVKHIVPVNAKSCDRSRRIDAKSVGTLGKDLCPRRGR